MTPAKTTPNNIKALANKRGMTFREFAGHCLLAGLSYDTARDAWYQVKKQKGYNPLTQATIAKVLDAEVRDVFGS
jgi:hypothetical protein